MRYTCTTNDWKFPRLLMVSVGIFLCTASIVYAQDTPPPTETKTSTITKEDGVILGKSRERKIAQLLRSKDKKMQSYNNLYSFLVKKTRSAVLSAQDIQTAKISMKHFKEGGNQLFGAYHQYESHLKTGNENSPQGKLQSEVLKLAIHAKQREILDAFWETYRTISTDNTK